MNDVWRFRFVYDALGDCCCDVERDPNGSYVDYNDYAKLEAELAELNSTVQLSEWQKMEADNKSLREAMTGWEGYAHKQGEYVDDIGEYFAALLEVSDAPR